MEITIEQEGTGCEITGEFSKKELEKFKKNGWFIKSSEEQQNCEECGNYADGGSICESCQEELNENGFEVSAKRLERLEHKAEKNSLKYIEEHS